MIIEYNSIHFTHLYTRLNVVRDRKDHFVQYFRTDWFLEHSGLDVFFSKSRTVIDSQQIGSYVNTNLHLLSLQTAALTPSIKILRRNNFN